MDRLAYTSLTGLSETAYPQRQLNNEIANLNTPGFKRSYSIVAKTLKVEGAGLDTRFEPSNTHVDRVALTPGPLTYTGNALDVALSGSTVMGVSAADGSLAFTRRGDLRVNASGQIETGAGQLVRGINGPLQPPAGYTLEITGDGSVYATPPNNPQGAAPVLVGRMLLRDASTTPLKRRTDTLLEPETPRNPSGDITDGPQAPALTPGAIEGSNVSAFESLVRLLELTRAYEANIRFIKEAKTIDEAGASMMKSS
jgi:flagellar basal-body rod protein FlgF